MTETTTLNATDRAITRLGLGGAATGAHGWGRVDDGDSIAAIRRAYELGVTHFDTADVYGLGHAERVLARALGQDMHRVTVATKFGVRWDASGRTWRDSSPEYLRQALDASLRRLGVERVSLYYVHWPDGVTPLAATLEELRRQQQAGKVDAVGLSNHSPGAVLLARERAPISAVQLQYSLIDRAAARAMLSATSTPGADAPTLVTWGSLGEGLLTGKYTAQSTFGTDDRRSRYPNFQGERFAANLRLVDRLKRIAGELGKSPAQTAVRWLLDTPGVGSVLFGAKTARQVDENLGAAGWRLPADAYNELASAARPTPAAA